MDAGACRASLAALLSEEIASLDQLAQMLEHEHRLLLANEVDKLEKAMVERQVTLGRLLQIEDDRRALCRAHGHSPDTAGIERLLAWCDPSGSLRTRWAQCTESATRCRALNDRNGALVTARMQRVRALLGALTGASEEGQTYGPAPFAAKNAYAPLRSGRVVSTEA